MSQDDADRPNSRTSGTEDSFRPAERPTPDGKEDDPASLKREIEQLRQDQTRLRSRLRSFQQGLDRGKGEDDGPSDKPESGDDKGQERNDAGTPNNGDDKDDGKGDSGDDKDAEKKPEGKGQDRDKGNNGEDGGEKKPPLLTRSRKWVRGHPLRLVVLLIVLAALIIGGMPLLRYLNSFESTDDAEIDGHLDPITSRINGTVVAVNTDNNQNVTQGQTIIELDPNDYNVALEQARANLAQANGQLGAENPTVPITETSNTTNVSTSEEDVASAVAAVAAAQHDYQSKVADLRQAEANNTHAQNDEVRYRDLVEKDETSKEFYGEKLATARADSAVVDSKRSAAEMAARVVAQRQAALIQAQTRLAETTKNNPRQISVRRASVEARKAAVDMAQAQVNQATLNLSYCKILAPVAGIVGDRTVELGQRVQPGEQLLALTEMNDLWVTANFKETELKDMKPGQRVTIHVDSLSRDFNGYVDSMPGATGAKYSLLPPENATGNYVKVVQRLPVRIRFYHGQDGLDLLRPGMSVEPKVWLK